MLNLLDLFSGIGGFSLGLERSGGFKTVAFCEIDTFCRKVLRKHWPDVRQYDDVRTLTADVLRRDGIYIDVICGGFPCQDISVAGKGAGLAGERSGLWREYARIIGELRPRYVIVENVSALLSRGLGDVLGDLAALGYDAEWHCIPASAVGAPHRRDRFWAVAYPAGDGHQGDCAAEQRAPAERFSDSDADRMRELQPQGRQQDERGRVGNLREDVADANGERRRQMVSPIIRRTDLQSQAADSSITGGWRWWEFEPDVGRVAHGVPARVDRLRGLGNSVVPQIPEIIGRAIMTRVALLRQDIGDHQ